MKKTVMKGLRFLFWEMRAARSWRDLRIGRGRRGEVSVGLDAAVNIFGLYCTSAGDKGTIVVWYMQRGATRGHGYNPNIHDLVQNKVPGGRSFCQSCLEIEDFRGLICTYTTRGQSRGNRS